MEPTTIIATLNEFFPGSFAPGSAALERPDTKNLIARLTRLAADPLRRTEFNQVVHLLHEAGISDGFFRFYFLEKPEHFYPVGSVQGGNAWEPNQSDGVRSIEQLAHGLRRFYIDALFCFGDLRIAYRLWRNKSFEELKAYFAKRRYDEKFLKARGPHLPFHPIGKDDRYLISEMAYGAFAKSAGATATKLEAALLGGFAKGGGKTQTVGDLISLGSDASAEQQRDQFMLQFVADELRNQHVTSEKSLREIYDLHEKRYSAARARALENTRLYLSLVNELDVYVATSMRTRADFRTMADDCEIIFGSPSVAQYNLRHFDPTLSAAAVSEDKGIIECLMVKCCQALLYFAGERDSYGKDTEVAMALSLGKPAIILCPENGKGAERARFFRDVHPLSRLIDFQTGVVCGAIVTQDKAQAATLLARVFSNQMQYDLEHDGKGYFRLRERLTGSVIRLQTSDRLLRESFWNYYHAEN